MRRFRLFLLAALLLLWGRTALYRVDQAEFAYVSRFGEPTQRIDGSDDAGLHIKAPWPIDGVQRVDRRLQTFDLPPTESLTRDVGGKTVDKTLTVDAFVCWRIPDTEALDRFIRTVGTPEQAKKLLIPRIGGRLAAVISAIPLEEWIAVGDDKIIRERSEKMHRRLFGLESAGPSDNPEPLRERILAEYGIEIVDIRLRRFNYPDAVRSSIAERIRSERYRKVIDYQSDGNRQYTTIVSDADRKAAEIVAAAKRDKEIIEGEAKRRATELLNAAQAPDPQFYAFLERLKGYREMFGSGRDTLLLSSRHELFKQLLNPPTIEEKPMKKAP